MLQLIVQILGVKAAAQNEQLNIYNNIQDLPQYNMYDPYADAQGMRLIETPTFDEYINDQSLVRVKRRHGGRGRGRGKAIQKAIQKDMQV